MIEYMRSIMDEKKRKILRFVGYIALFAYIIGMLFLVVYLKRQAQDKVIDYNIANAMFDLYTFSLGACLMIIMPFSIGKSYKRVSILSYFIFAFMLGMAIYIKYYTFKGEILADLLYIFSGAMLYQGVKYTIKSIKNKDKNLYKNDNNDTD